jgi:hypothetical protein
MAFYLVTATPHEDLLEDLEARLSRDEFVPLRPFGAALSQSLRDARRRPDGAAIWEEEDYCRPPLAEERAAVLDRYFDRIAVAPVQRGAGWKQIDDLPRLFPALAATRDITGR